MKRSKNICLSVFSFSVIILSCWFFSQANDLVTKVNNFNSIYRIKKPATTPDADASLLPMKTISGSDMPAIYGSLLYSSDWANLDAANYPYGVYSINHEGGSPELEFASGLNPLTATLAGDKYYVVTRRLEYTGEVIQMYLHVFDIKTWKMVEEYDLEPDWQYMPLVISYDQTDSKIYAIKYSDDWNSHELATLDTSSGEMHTLATLGQVGVMPNIYTLSSTDEGKLLAICSNGKLYDIDKTTGAMTIIGTTGYIPDGLQSTVYDYNTHTLYWAGVMSDDESGLYSVDCYTGVATLICNFKSYQEYVGLYILPEGISPDVPQKVDAAFDFDEAGGYSGTLHFTLPAKNNNGDAITDDLTVSIKVDDTEIRNYTAAPGSVQDIELTLSPGFHLIRVLTANEFGNSEASYINVFAGMDTPRPVADLKLKISETGLASLSWTETTESTYGGYVDFENIRYKVLRADGSLAAESLTKCNFSEQLPEVKAKHSYSVIAYTKDVESKPTVSNTIKYGDYYGVPFFDDFNSMEDTKEEYTVINNNSDGDAYTWVLTLNMDETSYVWNYYCNWEGPADDYLITPEIKFESQSFYKLSFQHSVNSDWATFVNNVEILAGKGSTIDDLDILIADLPDISSNTSGLTECYFSLPEDEMYNIAFRIYSDAQQSDFWLNDLRIEKVGMAEAPALTTFTTVVNNTEPEKVEITFLTPNRTASGNKLETLSAVNIYRDDDTTPCYTLSAPTPDTQYSWTDENPTIGLTKYRVAAVNEHGEGLSEFKSLVVGGYLPTFTETFDSEETFKFHKVLNINSDDKTWQQIDGAVQYEYNISKKADDWLMSPRIKMSADRVYKISFSAKSTIWASENFEMTIGTSQTPLNHEALVSLTDWRVEDYETHYAYFIPKTTATHYVGFHAFSRQASLYITLDEYTVEDAMSIDAPANIEDLSITADADGLLKTELSFSAPKKTAGGENLSELLRIDVYRNNDITPVYSFESPQPGQSLTWTDDKAHRGINKYRIVPVNLEGEGMNTEKSIFVGYDIPNPIVNPIAIADADNANTTISWEAPLRGVNDGNINSDALTYSILRTIYGEEEATEIASGLTETSFADNLEFKSDTQKIVTYQIIASTEEGSSVATAKTVVLGTPYTFPFEDSFADQTTHTTPWRISYITTQACDFSISSSFYSEYGIISPEDEDNGMVRFHKWNIDGEIGKAMLISPKIKINDYIEPILSFYVYHNESIPAGSLLTPYITVNDGDRQQLGDVIDVSTETGWIKYTYSLEDYTDADHFFITFIPEITSNSAFVVFDNVVIDDNLEHNLAVNSFSGSASSSSAGRFTFEIKNRGLNDATDYEVALYCNDTLVTSQAGKEIAPEQTKKFTFKTDVPSIANAGEIRYYHAEIIYDLDQKDADNVSQTIESEVYTPPYPVISDLSATISDGNNATLTWSEPSTTYYRPISEDFENATLFAIDGVKYWKFVDMDYQRTVSPKYGVTFDYCFDPKAWQVIDPQRINMYGTDVAPHSGYKCLISMQSDGTLLSGQVVEPCNDDWLISEEIAGGSEIKFWAMQPTNAYGGNEKFEVLYSSTDQEPENFKLIEEVELQGMAEWNEYVFTLPEDAKYFAIRHTLSFYGLWLDDITYHPIRKAYSLKISTYNVYRDGVQIGESSSPSYSDNALEDGNYTYFVSSVFDLGESAPSNKIEITVDYNSIADIDNSQSAIGSHKNCIAIRNAEGLTVCVYSLDGKLLHSSIANQTLFIPVESGIYIVKVGDTITKINVN